MFRARTPQGLPGHEFLLDFGVMHGSVLLAGIALGTLTFFIPSLSLSLFLSLPSHPPSSLPTPSLFPLPSPLLPSHTPPSLPLSFSSLPIYSPLLLYPFIIFLFIFFVYLSFQLGIPTVTVVPKSVHTQLVAKIDPNYIFKVLQNDVFLQRYLQVFQLV